MKTFLAALAAIIIYLSDATIAFLQFGRNTFVKIRQNMRSSGIFHKNMTVVFDKEKQV